jgi:hypothetical protein
MAENDFLSASSGSALGYKKWSRANASDVLGCHLVADAQNTTQTYSGGTRRQTV